MTEYSKGLAPWLERARALDAADPMARWRAEFSQPEPVDGQEPVYLCGNSLGLMPLSAAKRVGETLRDWANFAVQGHFKGEHPWMPYHHEARESLARLVGAKPDEVVAMNTLTANLHFLMASFFVPSGKRQKILIEKDAFPSDRYAVRSQLHWHGLDPETDLIDWPGSNDDGTLDVADLAAILAEHGDDIALMLLPGVQYLSGQVLDMASLAELAERHGIVLGLDLAHAIGNVPLSLHDQGVDFAAWCSYKYLNAGPGAVAGAFIHERHFADESRPRLLGWWGNHERSRLKMQRDYEPAPGADAWAVSNQPILALAPVMASLEIFDAAGLLALRKKSITQTAFLADMLRDQFDGRLRIITPDEQDARGCQLSLVVADDNMNPRALFDELEARLVIGDWREPDVIRVAPTPLYNNFSELVEFGARVHDAFSAVHRNSP